MGYALNAGEVAGEGGTGELLIADTEDHQTMPPSEIHVRKFKSKEVDIQKKRQ